MIKKVYILTGMLLIAMPLGFCQKPDVNVKRLSFNSKRYKDFAPVQYEKGLLFCSDRERNRIINFRTPEQTKLYDIYYVRKKESGEWGVPQYFSEVINTSFHEGPLSYHQETGRLYFTRNLHAHKKLGNSLSRDNPLGLFYSDCKNHQCENVEAFIHNNESYNIVHPSISPDGSKLFFASDKEGGYGGMDLYVVYKKNSSWSQPVNLGDSINTPHDEVYPFYHPGGKLYFSSDGHEGIRKLDIYYTTYDSNTWSAPVLLQRPVNSYADDYGYVANQKDTKGYFSSDREDNDDIYWFNYNIPVFPDCDTIEETEYCIKVYEKGTMKLDTTSLKYQWDMGDGTKIRAQRASHCYQDTGTYRIKLNVIDTLTDTVSYNEASYTYDLDLKRQVYISAPDTCYTGQRIVLNNDQTYLPEIQILKYIWKFDNGDIKKSSEIKYNFEQPGIHRVHLGAIGKGQNGEEQKVCSYKDIVVLPNDKK